MQIKMSFSSDVKKEMIAIQNKPCCMFAQSYGFLLYGKTFSSAGISLMTEYREIAEAYSAAVEYIGKFRPAISRSEAGRYTVSVPSGKKSAAIMREFGHDGSPYGVKLNFANIKDDCCRSSFLRGVFLACGTVTSPEKEYHLEFSISNKSLAYSFMKLFDEYNSMDPEKNFSLFPRVAVRNGIYVVYFKDSSSVEDFLTVTGAQNAAMEVMGAKVYKDIKNNVNRKVNFETANINRSVNAAFSQVAAIKKIIDGGALGLLPEDVRTLALLRLDEPEMSLRELGENMTPPMSRTAVNYRLKKILELADRI